MLIKNNLKSFGVDKSVEMAKQHISKFQNAKLDYLIVAETETLKETKQHKDQKIIALVAIDYEGVRLLDNMILN